MGLDGMSDEAVRDLLLRTRRIAVVGASDRPGRPSNGVFRFLLDRGYDAVPVNPALAGRTLHGVAAVAGLEGLGLAVDAERNAVRSTLPRIVSPDGARVAVAVVPTDEEWEIARETYRLIDEDSGTGAAGAAGAL